MKTELGPNGGQNYNLGTVTPNAPGAKATKLVPGGGQLPTDGKLPLKGDPAYKLDLSGASKAPVDVSAPSTPSLPSAPSLPRPSTPSPLEAYEKNILKSEAEDEAKKKAVDKAKEAAKPEAKEKVKEGSVRKPAIIFVSGWQMMFSPSKSEGSYAGLGRMAESVEGARLYGWDQKDEILEQIKNTHPDQPVILVGHSLGGDTAVEVSNALDSLESKFRKVDLLVTLDAFGFNNDIIPQNVKEHLNVFGEQDWFLNDGPHVARRNDKTTVTNILSPLHHTEFDDAKDVQFEIVNAIEQVLGKTDSIAPGEQVRPSHKTGRATDLAD